MNTQVTNTTPAAVAPSSVTREAVDINVADYLLADLRTNVYLLFKSTSLTESAGEYTFAFQEADKINSLSQFNPMHFDKSGERGIITKNFLNILESIQSISSSTIRAGEVSELEKCYVALSKTIEANFTVASWFKGVSVFITETRKPTKDVPKDVVPTIRMSLDKVTDDTSGIVHYENNVIITVNVDLTYSNDTSILNYAGQALVKLRKKVKDFSKINLFVGITDDISRTAKIANGLVASENNDISDDDTLIYYVLDGQTQTEEAFTYVSAFNKTGPFPEDRKSRDSLLKRTFIFYAKA